MASTPVCKRCFQHGHNSQHCSKDPAIACALCYRLNFFTVNCCNAPIQDDDMYHQSLRFSHEGVTNHLFIDVEVAERNVVAKISPGLQRSIISPELWSFIRTQTENLKSNIIDDRTVSVLVKIRNQFIRLNYNVTPTCTTARLILGTDFLDERPHMFKLD